MKVKRICEWCGKEFYVVSSAVKEGRGKHCCKECQSKSQSANFRGEKTSNWKGGDIERVCQYCGKTFLVRRDYLKRGSGKYCSRECSALSQRTGQVVKCLQCGKEFYVIPSVVKKGGGKYCSKTCLAQSQSEDLSGENSSAYKRLTRICPVCGKSFQTHDCRIKGGGGKYCSHTCASAAKLRGELRTCIVCGKEFYASRGEQKRGGGKFCSNVCVGKWASVNLSGKNSSNWRGGLSFEPYCEKFNNAFKERIRDKFGRTCFICGKTEEENGRKMSVHHVNYSKECLCSDDISCQFVPLCISCHMKTNENRDYWQELIMAKLRSRLDGYYM